MNKRLLRLGNEQLQITASPVTEFDTPELQLLIENLTDTMISNGGVGIAAPQIGVPLQVIVFGFETSSRYPQANPVPFTILINPSYQAIGDEMYDDWEGCLSVKGLRGLVHRHHHIQYDGYDLYGKKITREAHGFHARLVQHEIDHLNGMLFIERIPNLKMFGFEDEIIHLMQNHGQPLS
jgi:peptide deformylase